MDSPYRGRTYRASTPDNLDLHLEMKSYEQEHRDQVRARYQEELDTYADLAVKIKRRCRSPTPQDDYPVPDIDDMTLPPQFQT